STGADDGVAAGSSAQDASILTKKGVVTTLGEVVQEKRAVFVDVANRVRVARGIGELQVAEDVIRARWALRASIPLRPLGPLRACWSCWSLCSLWPGSTRITRGTLWPLGPLWSDSTCSTRGTLGPL